MFSMCGLLCRFLRGWRQNEAVGVMVHAATVKDASLIVETINPICSNASQTGIENSVFCQPFCAQPEEKVKQLLWRDNNKHAIIISPKEKIDIEKWSGFTSLSKNNESESPTKETSVEPQTESQNHTPNISRDTSNCSDCDTLIPVLLEATFKNNEEKSLYGYNVLVEQLAELYAWKLTDVFTLILYTTPTKLVTMIHAFFNHALLIKDGLRIQKILTVELTGQLSTFEDPCTIFESLTNNPMAKPKSPPLIAEEEPPTNTDSLIPTGDISTFEDVRKETLKTSGFKSFQDISYSPRQHPSLLEAKKKSSQSSEEDGSTDSDSSILDFHHLCPRGWAVSGLKSKSSLGLRCNQRVVLGQPLSISKEQMQIFSQPSEIKTSSRHFQSSLFTSVIPNPLNEFFAIKETLNQKIQKEKTFDNDNEKFADSHHKKAIGHYIAKNSFTNPIFQYFPQFQKKIYSRQKDNISFSPKFYNRSILSNQENSEVLDSTKRRNSIGKDHIVTNEPKIHSQPNKVKSEADLLKSTNIIKDNLANIIENYLTKSPMIVKSDTSVQIGENSDKKDPKVLLISDDKDNNESILMVTVDDSDLKLNNFCSFSEKNKTDYNTFADSQQLNTSVEPVKEPTEGFYLSMLSKDSDAVPGFDLRSENSLIANIIGNESLLKCVSDTYDSKVKPAILVDHKFTDFTKSIVSENSSTKVVHNQESNESDTAEQSFSEDSLNEKILYNESKSNDESEIELAEVERRRKVNHIKSLKPEVSPNEQIVSSNKSSKAFSDFLAQKYSLEHSSMEEDFTKVNCNINKTKELNLPLDCSFTNDLENEFSPLDSVKSICNSVSFDENSFSDDSLMSEKPEYQNEATLTESKLESFVLTPEDFNCKTENLDNSCKTEFPLHWHEEYVKVFSDVNQDLREVIHPPEGISFALEPIAEMDYSLREYANSNDDFCEINMENNKDKHADSSEKINQKSSLKKQVRLALDENKTPLECNSLTYDDMTKIPSPELPLLESKKFFEKKCVKLQDRHDIHEDAVYSQIDLPENYYSNKVMALRNKEKLRVLASSFVDVILEEAVSFLYLCSEKQISYESDNVVRFPFVNKAENRNKSAMIKNKNNYHSFSSPSDEVEAIYNESCHGKLKENELKKEKSSISLTTLEANIEFNDICLSVSEKSEDKISSSNIIPSLQSKISTDNVDSVSGNAGTFQENSLYRTNTQNEDISKSSNLSPTEIIKSSNLSPIHHSVSRFEPMSNFIPDCDLEKCDAQSYSEVSPILRSDESFAFGQVAKAVVSPVDSAPESGFASLKDSSHSEATSESGSGVPLSKSKDSLEMTDIERDRISGADLYLDDFDSLSTITGDHTQTGSSPASVMSSARGSLMEELVFNHSKGLGEIDIENVKIPSLQTFQLSLISSPVLVKRGKLMNAASLDSDHRSAGYKFREPYQNLSLIQHVNHSKFSDYYKHQTGSNENDSDEKNKTEISDKKNDKEDILKQEVGFHLSEAEKLENAKLLNNKSESEDSGGQPLMTSDSVSSSDTIISRISFEEQGKVCKDKSLENLENSIDSCVQNKSDDTGKYQNEDKTKVNKKDWPSNFSSVPSLHNEHPEIKNILDSDVGSSDLDSHVIDYIQACRETNQTRNDLLKHDENNELILKDEGLKDFKNFSIVKPSLTNVDKKKKKPKSFEEPKRNSFVEVYKPLSKSLSGEANVLNGRILHLQNEKKQKNIKSSTNSICSLEENQKGKPTSSVFHSDNNLGTSCLSDVSTESFPDHSLSSRSNTQTSSGSGEMVADKLSLKSQDSFDKFSYFESICAQAKPRSNRKKKVLSVDVESQSDEKIDSIHRSITLPAGSFSKSKDGKKKHREEKFMRKDEENIDKEKKSTLQSLKGFLKRSKSKESRDNGNKKTSPSLFRKLEKRKGDEISKSEKKSIVISHPSPILPNEHYALDSCRVDIPTKILDESFNDKTHLNTNDTSACEGVKNISIKSTLHRSNALASSAYISCSESENSSFGNVSSLVKKSNLNSSPKLYHKVLLKNISSSQESIESNGSLSKNTSPLASPLQKPYDSTSPTPLVGIKPLTPSPKRFSVTIGFKPQVEGTSKRNRTMSVGDNLHNISSSHPIAPSRESPIPAGTLAKRSSSMEILVYGKIREHNPTRKKNSGGCFREGSFKLHREISVETLMEIPETSPTLEERRSENYQEFLQRVHHNKDSRQSSTWSLYEDEDSLSESLPLEKLSQFPHSCHAAIHKKYSLPHNMHLKGPDEGSFSNPNLSRTGTLSRGLPLSSSFTSSPFRRPFSSISAGISPNKRGFSSQGKNIVITPDCDSCPASPLFEEEEDFVILNDDSIIKTCPPNILIYTANNEEYFESVKETFLNVLNEDRYAIYHLNDETAFKSPWKYNTRLLVVCGDVPTHVSTVFIRFLLSGGKVMSICSDFLNVAVPLFAFKLPWTSSLVNSGTVEVQEASVVSMSYSKWKNVQLLHHQHCFHSSPKHKPTKDVEKRSNTGSAVSVEPTFVEITDDLGVHHRLDLKVLAKDDTWGAPSLLLANVNGKSGKAIFSQVHLERDPNQCIACELKGEQLKKSNESRLEILKNLLSTYLNIDINSDTRRQSRNTLPDYTPAFLLGKHEVKKNFVEKVSKESEKGLLERKSLSISFHQKEEQSSIPSQSFLPILLTGYTKEFSTVKYFEELKTDFIGRLVIFCEVLTSTMDVVLGKTPLENGIAVIALYQRRGKGRYGNMWLSPLGCAMFSIQLHFTVSSNMGQCLPFLQHLASLAIVTSITKTPGYEKIPLKLKWPNDIYLGSSTKIGGVVVEVSIQGEQVMANIGCGINLSNNNPTTCINEAIKEYNVTEKRNLPELTKEVLYARIFNQMEYLFKKFQENGADDVVKEYYNYWLHGNTKVSVQNDIGKTQTATINGIDQYGYLKATLKNGENILLHPNGNSFNMMEGLICSKTTRS